MRELLCAVLLVFGPVTGADPTVPGCTGGIAPNPSVESGLEGYSGSPTLRLSDVHPFDGTRNAMIAGTGTAHLDLAAVPEGVYDLSVWTGTTRPGPATAVGLQFFDRDNVQVGRTYAKWPRKQKPQRLNVYGVVAPESAAVVRFFATADIEIHWDCVFLRVSAFSLALEAGDGTFRITATNTGSEPLTGVTLSLPECTDLDRTPFDLKAQVIRTCTGTATTATVTASGALYWNGALPDRSVTL